MFEAVYLQGKPQLQEPLKDKLIAELKTLYLAVFQYLVEATLYLERKSIS